MVVVVLPRAAAASAWLACGRFGCFGGCFGCFGGC
jgi:hypothetical protein